MRADQAYKPACINAVRRHGWLESKRRTDHDVHIRMPALQFSLKLSLCNSCRVKLAMPKRHIVKPDEYHLIDIVTGESHGGFVSLDGSRRRSRGPPVRMADFSWQ